MNTKLRFIYDDITYPTEAVKKIVGDNKYSDIIFKKKSFKNHIIESTNYDFCKFSTLSNQSEIDNLILSLDSYKEDTTFLHWFSSSVLIDREKFNLFLEKSQYANVNIICKNEKTLAFGFPNKSNYIKFLKEHLRKSNFEYEDYSLYNMDFAMCVDNYKNFQKYITDSFSTRYFNSITYTDYTVTKQSQNIAKIKKEHKLYEFLCDSQKHWFVQPYDYKETSDYASYTMERLLMTDVALQWVHKAVSDDSFNQLIKKIFYFISSRESKEVSREEYLNVSKKLYRDKVFDRMKQLKGCEVFNSIQSFIKNGTNYDSIEQLAQKYYDLYEKISSNKKRDFYFTVGHGDLCYSNILYDEYTNTVKLIDPMGALTKEDAFVIDTYDIAKLSHSVCGNYDYINTNLYDISLDENMDFVLNIDFDNTYYKNIFKSYLEKSGLDYYEIRLYECSLFLSMLPLHADKPRNVFAFVLNAVNILEEIENA